MEKISRLNTVLIDTGVIYALADRNDIWHGRAVDFLSMFRGKLIVPSSVIPEVCYLLNSFLGGPAELCFLNSLINKELFIEQIKEGDLPRIAEVLKKYNDLHIGFVDASVIAVAERLDIKKVLTTDRRHFSVVQPQHCERMTVLP